MAFSCRVCNKSRAANTERPDGWYKLNVVGDEPLTSGHPTCGFIGSLDCLVVSVMRPFGMTEREVREWLRPESA